MVPLHSDAPTRLKWHQFLFYSFGHVMNDLSAAIFFTYLLIFLWNVQGFTPAMAGNILLAGQLADGISTPFFGMESDKADKHFPACGRYGRRKSWHLFGASLVAITTPFIFSDIPGGGANAQDWAKVYYYLPIVCLSQMGWAATQVAHMSLIPDLTPNDNERVILNSVRYAAQVAANIIAYLVFFSLLGVESGSGIGPSDSPKFKSLAIICTTIGFFLVILFQIGVKEPKKDEDDGNFQRATTPSFTSSVAIPSRGGFAASFSVTSGTNVTSSHGNVTASHAINDAGPISGEEMKWSDWFKKPEFYLVTVIYMSSQVIFNVGQTYLPLYLTHTLLMDKSYIALLPIIVFTAGFIASASVGLLTKFLGNFGTSLLGTVIVISGCGWMYDAGLGIKIIGPAILLGSGQSIVIISAMAFISELIGDQTATAGFVYSFVSCMDKFAGGASIVIVQHLQPEEVPPAGTPMLFFRDVMTFLMGGVAVMSGVLVSVLWFLRFTKSKTKDNENDEFGSERGLVTTGAPMAVENVSAMSIPGMKRVSFSDHSTVSQLRGRREIPSSKRASAIDSGAIDSGATSSVTSAGAVSSVSGGGGRGRQGSDGGTSQFASSLMASIEMSAGAGPRGGAAILAGATWRKKKGRRDNLMTSTEAAAAAAAGVERGRNESCFARTIEVEEPVGDA